MMKCKMDFLGILIKPFMDIKLKMSCAICLTFTDLHNTHFFRKELRIYHISENSFSLSLKVAKITFMFRLFSFEISLKMSTKAS